jgi:hypothetical protein
MEPVLYEIKPIEALRARAQSVLDPHHLRILMKTRDWVGVEGDDAFPDWGPPEFLIITKLAHLASLADVDLYDEQFEEAFGTNFLTPALFDRWWTIRIIARSRRKSRETVDGYICCMLLGNIRSGRVAPTGSRLVDAWLEAMDSPLAGRRPPGPRRRAVRRGKRNES